MEPLTHRELRCERETLLNRRAPVERIQNSADHSTCILHSMYMFSTLDEIHKFR